MDKMKPKQKTRKSGYYWAILYGTVNMQVVYYYENINCFDRMGQTGNFIEPNFSYISPTPITIPKSKNK